MARPTIEPVTADTLPAFAEFLHRHLDGSRSPQAFAAGLAPRWADQPPAPNHGFMLREAGEIVGGIGAIYATRQVDGEAMTTCNITGWCVLDSHRQQSMRLAMAITSQPGLHFTDFSPTKVVAGTLQFLKFKPLEERRLAALNLPSLPMPGGMQVVTGPDAIRARLSSGQTRTEFDDHLQFPWLHHLLLGDGQRWCHVVYKRRSFKRLPAADVLHASDRNLLRSGWRRLQAHLLAQGLVSTHVDHRLMDATPWPSALRSGFNNKVFQSSRWQPDTVDCLYSESVTLDL